MNFEANGSSITGIGVVGHCPAHLASPTITAKDRSLTCWGNSTFVTVWVWHAGFQLHLDKNTNVLYSNTRRMFV